MTLVILSFLCFAIIMTMMAVGVIFSDRCLRGSCGGREIIGPDGEILNCETCPAREEKDEEIGTRVD